MADDYQERADKLREEAPFPREPPVPGRSLIARHRCAVMTDASYYLDQAARFERVADQCSVPELVPYYRKLAREYRARADEPSGRPVDRTAALLDGEMAD